MGFPGILAPVKNCWPFSCTQPCMLQDFKVEVQKYRRVIPHVCHYIASRVWGGERRGRESDPIWSGYIELTGPLRSLADRPWKEGPSLYVASFCLPWGTVGEGEEEYCGEMIMEGRKTLREYILLFPLLKYGLKCGKPIFFLFEP